jgi:hypothetical protein
MTTGMLRFLHWIANDGHNSVSAIRTIEGFTLSRKLFTAKGKSKGRYVIKSETF